MEARYVYILCLEMLQASAQLGNMIVATPCFGLAFASGFTDSCPRSLESATCYSKITHQIYFPHEYTMSINNLATLFA
jgi:hypothetical protein